MDGNPLHDKTNYQGDKLARLLAALALPAFLYYVHLALAFAAQAGSQSNTYLWLMRGSAAALVLFFPSELGAALYLRGLFKAPKSHIGQGTQILGIFVVCGLVSIGAAVLLESFAYELLIRRGVGP